MNSSSNAGTPQSPEVQPAYVRDELDQDQVTHVGEFRQGDEQTSPKGGDMHMGAVDTEVMPVVPPMAGPADLVGERNEDAQGNETGSTEVGQETYDPRDELTPG